MCVAHSLKKTIELSLPIKYTQTYKVTMKRGTKNFYLYHRISRWLWSGTVAHQVVVE